MHAGASAVATSPRAVNAIVVDGDITGEAIRGSNMELQPLHEAKSLHRLATWDGVLGCGGE